MKAIVDRWNIRSTLRWGNVKTLRLTDCSYSDVVQVDVETIKALQAIAFNSNLSFDKV